MSRYKDALIEAAWQAYQAGYPEQAETSLRLAVGGSAHDAYALYFIGHLSYLRGDLESAVFCLSTALLLAPDNARAHNDLGESLRALGHNDLALPHLRKAIALEPGLAHAYGNLATVLLALDQPDEALIWSLAALWRATDKAVAHCDLGSVFGRLGRVNEALRQFQLALELRPDDPHARYFESLTRLSLGDLPAAWDGHEQRLKLPQGTSGRRTHAAPRWCGAPDIAGRSILLHAEQGLGDTIQFVRYAPLVAALGARVVLEVQPALCPLLRGLPGIAAVHGFGDPLPHCDLQCPLLSLPAAFQTSLASIPATVPYLSADPARVVAWQQRLGPRRRMRVGLAWSGSAGLPTDIIRSIPLSRFDALLARDDLARHDIEWHVIQRDIRRADAEVMAERPALIDHSPRLTDFAETGALVSLMDLVIAVDTAPAHLAGALGKPTWLLLSHSPDWRWLRDRSDSPWYPSLRLFRQPRRGDWQPVLDTLARQLDRWPQRR